MSGSTRVAIWNPVSGTALEEPVLREALGEGVDVLETTADDPGAGHAADAVADGAEIVVACGGDGTVRACLDALAGSSTALAIVPLGTGNLLASNLDIPPGVDAAAGIGCGPRRSIDLGRINGEAFAVMAGTGFDALMIRDARSDVKSKLGSIAYVISGARHLRTELVPTSIDVDGQRWLDARTSMVLVGNFGTITGGIAVFPDALPDDGVLELAVVAAENRRDWARIGWALVTGRPAPSDLVRRTRGRRFVIDHARPREYELDGEARDAVRHIDIAVEPGALTLHQTMSPRPPDREDGVAGNGA